MLRKSPRTSWSKGGKAPQVSPLAYVHESAILIGEVYIEENAIICPGAIIRADEGSPIIIGEGSNVQDGVIMHCLKGTKIQIGRHCSIAHGAVIHGPCEVGDGTFVGFRAVLLKARVGEGCFVGHGAQILGVDLPGQKYVPPGVVLEIEDAIKCLKDVSVEQKEFAAEVVEVNHELRRGYQDMMYIERKL